MAYNPIIVTSPSCNTLFFNGLKKWAALLGRSWSRSPRNPIRASHEPQFAVREALFRVLGVDLSQIDGFSAYAALKLVGECGMDMSRWPTEKHFTSWLTLAPGNKISGGKVLNTKTRRSANRTAAIFRLSAMNVGQTHTALGAFYRRLASRSGKAKAVTATARKLAVLFYNTLRYGMAYEDPGAAYYEDRYRQRVLKGLRRRAKQFGYKLTEVGALEGSFLGKASSDTVTRGGVRRSGCGCRSSRAP